MFEIIFLSSIILLIVIIVLCNQSVNISDQIKKGIKEKYEKNSDETYNLDYNKDIEKIDMAIKLYKKDILREINALLQDKEALINSDFDRNHVDIDYYKEKEYNPIWLLFKGKKSNWLNFLPTIKDIFINYKIKKSYISVLKPGYTISSYLGDKSTLRYTICLASSEDFFILNKNVINFNHGLIWDHSLIHHYSNNGSKDGIYLHIEIEKQLPLTVQFLYKITKSIDNFTKD